MKPKIDYTLYLVTNRELMSSASIEECVELAILGGCTVVQLREKTASSREFFNTAMRVREITARHGVPLIINDRADIALAVNADGLHIGQNDLPYEEARKILGAEKIIGVSANTLSRAKAAAEAGADYLGVGAMFSTGTKTDAITIDRAELNRIREAVKIPIVAIGGINKTNVTQLRGTGINGIAVVSAVVAEQDITDAARNMKSFLKEEII